LKKRTIDISNYEEWFIDHLDGSLNEIEESELTAFLDLHPELAGDLEEISNVNLNPDVAVYPNKAELLIPTGDDIALMTLAEEGELDTFQELSEEDKRTFTEWKRTILSADESIMFPDKELLMKKERGLIIPLWAQQIAVAASLIGVMFLLLFNTEDPVYNPRTAEVEFSDSNIDETFTADLSEFYTGEQEPPITLQNDQQTANPRLAVDDKKDDGPEPIIRQLIPDVEDHIADDTQEKSDETLDSEFEDESVFAQQEKSKNESSEEDPYVREVENAGIAMENASSDSKSSNNEEYNSVLDFLKGSLTKSVEDSDLLAMEDNDPEDPYVKTSLRIGRFEVSRSKRRSKK
jgi:hypothetical protein